MWTTAPPDARRPTHRGALRLDRYLAHGGRLVDLATGARVRCRWHDGTEAPLLFSGRGHRVLIDIEAGADGRHEIWERRWGDRTDGDAKAEHVCVEALQTARHGAPRLLTLETRQGERRAGLIRRVARGARVRGWVPIAASQLHALAFSEAGPPSWLTTRSLVIFEDTRGIEEAIRLLWRVAPSAAPHVLIAWHRRHHSGSGLARGGPHTVGWPSVVRESKVSFGYAEDVARAPTARDEASARWPVLLASATGQTSAVEQSALPLARLLLRRGHTFEARGWLAGASVDSVIERERSALLGEMNDTSRRIAGIALGERVDARHPAPAGRDGMVDDFVGVLQLCQDIEDERVALSRVGAYVRERL